MAFDPTRLYSALLNTGLQTKDNPLYQVIHQLIKVTSQLTNDFNISKNGTTGGNSITIIQQLLGIHGEDGLDGYDGFPGLPGSGSGTSFSIPELDIDPISPLPGDTWVLKTVSGGGSGIPDGTPIGLLLGITYTGNSSGGGDGTPLGILMSITQSTGVLVITYQLSYRTIENTTIRVTLS